MSDPFTPQYELEEPTFTDSQGVCCYESEIDLCEVCYGNVTTVNSNGDPMCESWYPHMGAMSGLQSGANGHADSMLSNMTYQDPLNQYGGWSFDQLMAGGANWMYHWPGMRSDVWLPQGYGCGTGVYGCGTNTETGISNQCRMDCNGWKFQ